MQKHSSEKKKIVFVLGSLKTGGAERNLAKTASYFADNYDVHLILFEKIIEFPIHPSIHIHNIGLSRYKNKLIKIIRLYTGIFAAVWKLRPLYVIGFARVSSQILALTFYPRVIARFDSYPFDIRWYRTFSALVFFNFFNVRHVVCPSKEIKEKIAPYFIRKGKLKVIGNPVDVTLAQVVTDNVDAVSYKSYIIVVGRLSQRKHVDSVIHAYSNTAMNRLFDLVIVGDGPEAPKLKEMAMKSPISNKIHFIGFKKEPYTLIQKASLLVLASSKEGFPTVLVEALSLGVPVLSSNCRTGPSEIVQHGLNGWLYSLTEKEALLRKFEEIAANPEILTSAAINARASVTMFDTKAVMDKWKELF